VAATSAVAATKVATLAPAPLSCALPAATLTDSAAAQAANHNDTGNRS
jgi:hypothetical protein